MKVKVQRSGRPCVLAYNRNFLLCYLEIAILISVTSDLHLQLFNVIST